jgi:hypothetical protein
MSDFESSSFFILGLCFGVALGCIVSAYAIYDKQDKEKTK